LHLPHQAFAQAGEEVELSSNLEQDILASQGWKIEAVLAEPDKGKTKEINEPPKDRTIKEAKVK
jgi:hypothetical protein